MNSLPKIDVTSIIDELDLETKARDQARKHMPNKDSTEPDFVEHQIIDYINDLKNRGRSEAEAVVMGLQKRFAEIDLESYEREIRDLPDYIHLQVDRELTNHREELIELRRNERIRLAELSAFEDEHKLVNGAEYPESQIYHWAIVGAMVLTESIANSYFFAKGSDLGLVGGILQAMLISIVNIGAGLLAGHYLLRYVHHISPLKKYFAWVFLILYACFVLALNLATAHYRALLETDPLTALVNVFLSLRKGPFAFDNFDAVILLSIGIIFAILAVIKSYRSDAFYPRHGLMDRRHLEANEIYKDAKEDAWHKAFEVMDEGSRTADRITTKARNGAVEQPIILDHIEQFSESFRRYNTELQDALVTLIKTYRARNEKIRNSPSPSYFKTYPELDTNSDLPLTRLKEDREKAKKTGAYLKAIEATSNEFSKNLRQQNKEITKDIEDFIKKIEDKADEDASEHFESRTSSKSR